MATAETKPDVKAKILLDEANVAFSETAERKDQPNERKSDGSVWNIKRMEREYDEADFQKILDMQLTTAKICDEHPELEEKTSQLSQSITPKNAEEILKQVTEDKNIMDLARTGVVMFLLRFPSVESFINKGHALITGSDDDFMLQKNQAQNWHDYNTIAQDFDWL
ncbi:MAG: hypothetical protein CMH78_04305 [Nitrospinae bacterium]|jgi:hypothetical protein|nr:hypothetical protein [Nitrospinota bacterium]HJP18497.1 hypothetical protein [Nitrospinota bacterium]|tara:strand:+ start:337 stop:834 length:498 start_codon:yes stop_codon:yes gene_type:complete